MVRTKPLMHTGVKREYFLRAQQYVMKLIPKLAYIHRIIFQLTDRFAVHNVIND
jgi:hypothetical protein